MRYIDKTGCKSAFEKGADKEIKSLGKLTRAATKIAENRGLGLLKTRQGYYRVIKQSGLGAYEDFFSTLEEVDTFLKKIR
ncbi:MAG: hypothetical protein HFH82_16165 [Lachnospiraceae bacterium]|nr:hypothetical protein [Lachnospiraceae bacterium]